jgi:filamentous hemagglutinin family protein
MNKGFHKNIFSKRLGHVVAVGENACAEGKKTSEGGGYLSKAEQFIGALKFIAIVTAIFLISATSTAATELPKDGKVVSGTVQIQQNQNTLNISQSTEKAIINWQSFNVGANDKVNIQQNNASSVLLNRVVGNDPSKILGQVNANGQVYLLNPNGILFGKNSSVTASSFTASTFKMADEDFLKGKYLFSQDNNQSIIENHGKIQTKTPGGYVALIGANIDQSGLISTNRGDAILASGQNVQLSVPLSQRIKINVSASSLNSNISQNGVIQTKGGQVFIKASSIQNAISSISQKGLIDSSGLKGGDIQLLADHSIDAKGGQFVAHSLEGQGGSIIVGRNIETDQLTKQTDVSSATFQTNQGFVETSGDFLMTEKTQVMAKDWLLDPTNIIITSSSSGINSDTNAGTTTITPNTTGTTTSNVDVATINNALNAGTNVSISTTNTAGTGVGNITVNSAISKTAGTAAALSLIADGGIILNSSISSTSDKLDVNLLAKGSGGISGAGAINTNGGILTLNTQNSAANGTLSGIISGSGSIYKTGPGIVTLSNNNTYTGGTLISKGGIYVAVSPTSIYGGTPGTVTLGDEFTGTSDVQWMISGGVNGQPGAATNLIVSNQGTGKVTIGTHSPGIFSVVNGPLTLGRDITFWDGGGDRFSFEGKISGTGNITMAGNKGTSRITMGNSNNSFVGKVIVNSGITLQAGGANILNSNDLENNGYFNIYIGDQTIGGLSGSGLIQSIVGGVKTLTINNQADTTSTFAGVIQNGNAQVKINKNGGGTQIFSGNNTYSGATLVNAGTLQIGSGGTTGSAGSSALTVMSNANLNFYRRDAALNINNAISGAGNVQFLGTGVQGQSSYYLLGINSGLTGNVSISSSRVVVSAANQLGASTVNVNNGGALFSDGAFSLNNTLNLSGKGWGEPVGDGQLGALRLKGTTYAGNINLLGDTRIGAWSNTGSISGNISGDKNLEIYNGTLYLKNANTYTGITTITGGTVQIENGNALGTGSTVVTSGATLEIAGQSINNNLTLTGSGVGAAGSLKNSSLNTGVVNGNVSLSGDTLIGGTGSISINGAVSSNNKKMTAQNTGDFIANNSSNALSNFSANGNKSTSIVNNQSLTVSGVSSTGDISLITLEGDLNLSAPVTTSSA